MADAICARSSWARRSTSVANLASNCPPPSKSSERAPTSHTLYLVLGVTSENIHDFEAAANHDLTTGRFEKMKPCRGASLEEERHPHLGQQCPSMGQAPEEEESPLEELPLPDRVPLCKPRSKSDPVLPRNWSSSSGCPTRSSSSRCVNQHKYVINVKYVMNGKYVFELVTMEILIQFPF